MTRTFRSRAAASVLLAIATSVLVSGQTLAVWSWSPPVRLDRGVENAAHPGGLVTVGLSTMVMVYRDSTPDSVTRIYVRRSTDAGRTWAQPVLISRPGDYVSWDPAIAAYGNRVEVVWTDNRPDMKAQVRYSTSGDGGASFSPSIALSPFGSSGYPSVARGPGLVAVSWSNTLEEYVSMRRSTDGGATFAPPQRLWSSHRPVLTAVAFGEGVMYAAHTSAEGWGIELRHSLDAGLTWSHSRTLAGGRAGTWSLGLVAEGDVAYLSYALASVRGNTSTPTYRRTINAGATWSDAVRLGSRSLSEKGPMISLHGGVARAAITVRQRGADDFAVFYTESGDGVTWTPPERISPDGFAWAYGVGVATRLVVGFVFDSKETGISMNVRTKRP
jgi:hypothetical protein